MNNNIKIFIWSWNTQSTNFKSNNFIKELKKCTHLADLIIIGLQEDTLQSTIIETLEKTLSEYNLVKQDTMLGWGITTLKKLKTDYEYCLRGLNIALFCKKTSKIQINNIIIDKIVCLGLQNYITFGKGAIVLNIDTNIGNLTFVNAHLPFSSKSIYNGERYKDLLWQSKCLNDIYIKVIDKFGSNNIFLFGDLNFRVQIRNEDNATKIATELLKCDKRYYKELLLEADELRLLQNYYKNTWGNLLEGIKNNGPLFLPTCKLKHGRSNDYNLDMFKLGKYNQRVPSWCDRILYSNGKCIYYNRWEYGDMNLSDHSSVIGLFTM
jgi:hypothetical protein